MKKIIGIITLFTMISCGIYTKKNQVHTVFKIERTPCFGKCPVYKLELFDNKTITYDGIKNVKRIGKEDIQLTDEQYNNFIQQISSLPFADYKLQYGKEIRDVALIYVTYKGKRIQMTQGKVPEKLNKVIKETEQEFKIR